MHPNLVVSTQQCIGDSTNVKHSLHENLWKKVCNCPLPSGGCRHHWHTSLGPCRGCVPHIHDRWVNLLSRDHIGNKIGGSRMSTQPTCAPSDEETPPAPLWPHLLCWHWLPFQHFPHAAQHMGWVGIMPSLGSSG